MQKRKSKLTKSTVVIEVRDGIAEVEAKPVSIRVIVNDHDHIDSPKGYSTTIWK